MQMKIATAFSSGGYTKSNLPKPHESQIWLDFDGTVTKQDVLDELIRMFAINDSWKISEARWQAGEIGSRQCLEEQFELLRISESQLENALNQIELDEGFFTLIKVARSHAVPVTIVSDCGDIFISRLLKRYKISNIPFRCNKVIHEGNRLTLSFPYQNKFCESEAAHCKCSSIQQMSKPGTKIIYVGDGRSDLCAARKADFVFAKGILADCLEKENIRFERFSNLDEIAAMLLQKWQNTKECGAKPELKTMHLKAS